MSNDDLPYHYFRDKAMLTSISFRASTAPYIHPEHTWHPVELYGDYDEEQGIAWYLTDEDKGA